MKEDNLSHGIDRFEAGDRVVMSPMWKHNYARGTVLKKTKDRYVVIVWDGVNGEWYYAEDQSKDIYFEDRMKDEIEMWKRWGDK